MKGFAEYGLIVCPHIDSYEYRTIEHKRLLKRSVDNIISLLRLKEIKPLMLLTDQVANIISPTGVYWSQTITPADLEFAMHNCDNISPKSTNVVTYPDFYEAVEIMAPPIEDGNATTEEKFSNMCKRVELLEKAIIQRQTVIFNIQTPNNASFNIKPQKDKPVILCNVHNGSFQPTTYIGEMEENPMSILDYEYGNLPVFEWRF